MVIKKWCTYMGEYNYAKKILTRSSLANLRILKIDLKRFENRVGKVK